MLSIPTVILQGSSAAIHLKTSAPQSTKQLEDKQPHAARVKPITSATWKFLSENSNDPSTRGTWLAHERCGGLGLQRGRPTTADTHLVQQLARHSKPRRNCDKFLSATCIFWRGHISVCATLAGPAMLIGSGFIVLRGSLAGLKLSSLFPMVAAWKPICFLTW